MGTLQPDGLYNFMYAFTGRYCLAQAEALRAILTHEKIPFQTGQGANGAQCVFIKQEDTVKVKERIQQWYEAVHAVHREVWGPAL